MRSSKVLTLFSRPITTSLITNTKNDKTNATPTSIKMGSPLSNSFQPPKKTNKYITIRQRRNIPAHLKNNLILSFISLPPCKFLFIVLFIANFAFVLQRLRAKPIPLKLRTSKGSLREGAGAGGLPRATEGECVTMRLIQTQSYEGSFHRYRGPPHPLADGISEGGFLLAPL